MSRIWTFIAAVCLSVSGLLAGAAPANAGGVNILVYERYQRVTILSRHHHGFRPHGYRLRRPGYVFHNGLWFSPRSMRAGVIVDVPIPRRHVVHYGGLGSHHYNWCADRYRSYHWRSNTFQPYHGPRRQCHSPYR
jgi:hypothetical protein